MLRHVFWVASLAGCYQPSIEPCVYACDGLSCPDGLTCMAGMCSNTETGACKLDAGFDPTDLTHVVVDVIDPLAVPIAGATVVFSGPSGDAVAADLTTDATGHVEADVPIHSNVTIVRTTTNGDLEVTAYVDIWPDAHVISQFDPPAALQRMVTVSWTSAGTPYSYTLAATCDGTGTGGTAATSASLTVGCASVDVVLLATGPAVAARGAAAGNQGGATVSLGALTNSASFVPAFTHVPGSEAQITLDVSAYVTPANAMMPSLVQRTVTGGVGQAISVPSTTGVTVSLTSRNVTEDVKQLLIERFTLPAAAYTRDFATDTLMEWPRLPSFDLPAQKLIWTSVAPQPPVVAVPPTFVMGSMTLQRGGSQVLWHVIAPGSAIGGTGFAHVLALPTYAQPYAFVPRTGDTVQGMTSLIRQVFVQPALLDTQLRSRFEGRGIVQWDLPALRVIAQTPSP